MKGHIVKRAKGSWSLVVDLGRDAYGKRRQKWITVKGTRRAAERELARIIHEFETGSFIEPSRMSVAHYVPEFGANGKQDVTVEQVLLMTCTSRL